MPIGLLTLEIYIPEAHSLKDKRQVLRSLKDRLRGKFNVAVAELEGQDSWQRSVVGVVSLANNAGFLEQAMRTVLEESERHLGRDLIGQHLRLPINVLLVGRRAAHHVAVHVAAGRNRIQQLFVDRL